MAHNDGNIDKKSIWNLFLNGEKDKKNDWLSWGRSVVSVVRPENEI